MCTSLRYHRFYHILWCVPSQSSACHCWASFNRHTRALQVPFGRTSVLILRYRHTKWSVVNKSYKLRSSFRIASCSWTVSIWRDLMFQAENFERLNVVDLSSVKTGCMTWEFCTGLWLMYVNRALVDSWCQRYDIWIDWVCVLLELGSTGPVGTAWGAIFITQLIIHSISVRILVKNLS
jgi:hypothetical protein